MRLGPPMYPSNANHASKPPNRGNRRWSFSTGKNTPRLFAVCANSRKPIESGVATRNFPLLDFAVALSESLKVSSFFRVESVANYQTCETKCLSASSSECVAYQYFENQTCQFMTLCTGLTWALTPILDQVARGWGPCG